MREVTNYYPILLLLLLLLVFVSWAWTKYLVPKKEARAKNKLLTQAIQAMPNAIFIVDQAGQIVMSNLEAERLFGYAPGELLGQNVEILLPARFRNRHSHHRKTYLMHPEIYALGHGRDLLALCKDGREFPVEIGLNTIDTQGGTLILATLIDITKRKAAEDKLRQNEALLRTIIDASPDFIFVKDRELRYQLVNQSYALAYKLDSKTLTGKLSSAMIGKTDQELGMPEAFVYGDPANGIRGFWNDENEVLTGGQTKIIESESLVIDGQTRYFHTVKSPLIDEEGQVQGLLGFIHNITEREHLLREVRQSQQFLRTVLDAIPNPIFIMNREGAYTGCNQAFLNSVKMSEAELLGKTVFDIVPNREEAEKTHQANLALFQNPGSQVRETALEHPDGSLHCAVVSKATLTDSEGQVTGLVGVTVDITERKQMEEELREAKTAAEAASRAKSEFLANMSHEIRTPMNGVIGMTELALGTNLTPEQRDYLTTVQGSAETLLHLLNDILDFSKIEAGRLELENIDFNLWQTVEQTVDILTQRAFAKGLELMLDLQPGLPVAVKGDPHRFRQVLVNLIGNAIKFTDQGEILVSVRLSIGNEQQVTLECAVTDTGIGIPLEKQPQIFEGFSQADGSVTRQYGGTGLGLTISKQLIEMMGGTIWVNSQVGEGTTFCFTVVLKRGKLEVQPPLPEAAALHGVRVLIVDDNDTNRRIVRKTLRGYRCLSVEAADGPTGLRRLTEARTAGEPFDLLLLDIHMPGMSGLEMLDLIRQMSDFNDLPVVMLSSVDQISHLNRQREPGWSAYLPKPVKQMDLINTILAVLNQTEKVVRPAPGPAAGVTSTSRPLKILLAEDNEVNRRVAVGILERAGHRVIVAENGRVAVERLQEQPDIEVVLMDVQMPEMDGLQATALIRQDPRWQNLPIIALTAHAMQGDREQFLAAGMTDYISKPIRANDIVVRLERLQTSDAADKESASLETTAVEPATIFDRDSLVENLGGDDSFIDELLTEFLKQIEQQLPQISAAIEGGDMVAVRKLSHGLKGSAAAICAESLRAVAFQLEECGRAGRIDQAITLLPALQQAAADFQNHVATHHPHLLTAEALLVAT